MSEDNKIYSVYSSDVLKPGDRLLIEHTVNLINGKADITELALLPLAELEKKRADSVDYENTLFTQLQTAAGKWEKETAQTRLLDNAIAYVKTPEVSHTSNQWVTDKCGNSKRSNTVYEMNYHVYEETKYNREKGKSEVSAWFLTWDLRVQTPGYSSYYNSSAKIAGQDRKKFTDKAAMDKYLTGRIAAYDSLFTEISPPIPKGQEKHFKVNGLLLPGYTAAGDELGSVRVAESDRPLESVMDRIAADETAKRENGAKRGAETPDKVNRRKNKGGAELE